MRYARLLLAAIVAGLLGVGCAGGGGGGGSVSSPPPGPPPPPPPPPFPPVPSTSSSEYLNNWGVAGTQAITAWQAGYTGDGVTVAVIDSGFDPTHPELVGQLSVASVDIVGSRNQLNDPTEQHGSEVASFIVGNYNGSQTIGVAYGAEVLAIRADGLGGGFSSFDLTNAINYAVAQNADVINLSLGSSLPLSGSFETALANATAAGVIVVVSAGNDGNMGAVNPDYPAYYATNAGISHGLIIAAGGSNSSGNFVTVSNPAGAAANFYLVAPGWEVVVPDFGAPGPVPGYQQCWPTPGTCTGLVEIQGTSYASPHISGAAALVMDAFPGLTSQQVVQLLLISADDMGAAGVDSQTGHGRLNITAAFSAVGSVAAPLAGGNVSPGDMIGVAGPAFGDAFANREAWRVVGFDAFGRSFTMTLADSWRPAPRATAAQAGAPRLWQSVNTGVGSVQFAPDEPAPPLAANALETERRDAIRIRSELAPGLSLSFASNAELAPEPGAQGAGSAFLSGDGRGMALTQRLPGGLGLEVLAQTGETNLGAGLVTQEARAARATFDAGPLSLAATYGALEEDGAGLGLTWGARWGGKPQGETHFVGVAGSWRLSNALELGARVERGTTRMNGAAWLKPDGEIATSSASVGARWRVRPAILAKIAPDSGGALTVSVSQPLRVESGGFLAWLPTSDEYGVLHLAYEQRVIGAEPSGRELETSVGYSFWQGDKFSALAEVRHRAEPGHSAAAVDEVSARLGLRKAF